MALFGRGYTVLTCVVRQLIQVIKSDSKQPRCVKPTDTGLMTAAISVGSAVGMRTPKGPLNVRFHCCFFDCSSALQVILVLNYICELMVTLYTTIDVFEVKMGVAIN